MFFIYVNILSFLESEASNPDTESESKGWYSTYKERFNTFDIVYCHKYLGSILTALDYSSVFDSINFEFALVKLKFSGLFNGFYHNLIIRVIRSTQVIEILTIP